MRIIHWCSSFLAGGSLAESVLGLANAQRLHGQQVLVVSREHRSSPAYNSRLRTDLRAELHAWEPVVTVMLGRLPVSLIPPRSVAVLRKYRADILHVHNGILPEDILARHLIPSTRAVLTPHGAVYPQALGRKLHSYLSVLKPLFYSRLAAFHALSPEEARAIGKLFRRREIYVVPNGLSADFTFQRPPYGERDDTTGRAIKLACVGRLDIRTKGLDILLHSFARAAVQSRQRLELVLVGPQSGNDYVSLLAMIDQLGIGDRVLFTGMTDREGVARNLTRADIFVQMSRWEACSLAAIEAIALELPCILSSHSGVATYSNIASLPHIHIVDPHIEQVTRTILEVASSLHVEREAARKFGPSSRQFFSWERAADEHARAYSRLMAT
jgi:glycosyltransferase involved in cell wall biosynthesis